MSKNSYFTTFLIGVILWIFLFHVLEDWYLSCILLIFFTFLSTILSLYYRQIYKLSITLILALIIGVSFAGLRFENIKANMAIVDKYSGLYNSYAWTVKELNKRSDYYDEYVIEHSYINRQEISSNILSIVRIPKNFELHPGQEISYSGKLYEIEDFNGFSYKKYLISKEIYFSSSTSVFETISENKTGIFYRLFIFRNNLLSTIAEIFPEQEAIFLWGILFWARENIPQDLKEDFNNSWLTHFIAVSGFNITLCIIFVTFLFGFLSPIFRIIAVISTIVLFSVFVWLWAPVVRAAIMGIVWYTFLQSGNSAKNITLLAFTALCMWLWSPMSLNYDVSLHLSFLAVIGIMYTQDIFQKMFYWVPQTFAIREALVLTLAALSFSLPIMIFQFGQVSLFAPFANIAVTWTIPLAMIGGSITLITYYLFPFLGEIFGFFTWILLHYDMLVVRLFWNLEFALWKIDLGIYNTYAEILYFIVLIYILTLYHIKQKKQP